MSFSGYNQQQQQQQQQQLQNPYDYDPSQIQPYQYDQSYSYQQYQQYYAYNPQYAYFPDTSQVQFQPQSTILHPPGVNPPAADPVPSIPAHAPTGPSQYRGRGGRGGRSFRGGGRGRGRGRGFGGGRHFPSHSSGPAIVADAAAAAADGATSVVQPSSSISGPPPLPKSAQVQAPPSKPPPPPPRKVSCEICKVECNTPEVLEQHKNGKRHQKKVKIHEELQRQRAIQEQQSEQVPTQVQQSEKNGCPTENMDSEVTADNHNDGKEPQNTIGETSEVPAEAPEAKTTENSAVRGRGLKRKMRGGRGGKSMRSNEGSKRPVKPPKPEQAVSFICELCNVKCESQVVYQSHLTGKKHLSSLKRAGGQPASSGSVGGLQAMYPPDINALSNAINAQVQQGDNDPQVLLAQLLMNVLSQAQAQAMAPSSGPGAAQIPAITSVAGSSSENQLLQTQISEIKAHVDALAGSNISTQFTGGSAEIGQQVLNHPQDISGMTSADNSGVTNDQIPSNCEAPTS